MSSRVLERELSAKSTLTWRLTRYALLALVVAVVAYEMVGQRRDAELTRVTQALTGNPAHEVQCQRIWDDAADPHTLGYSGFVEWGSDVSQLRWGICADALRWHLSPEDPDTRFAFMVVAHEAGHLAGHRAESTTDCVAMWAAGDLSVAFGRSRAEGEAVARWYQTTVNPTLRHEYRAPRCLQSPRPSSPMLD